MKILCIGRNYAEHAAELRNEIPEEPVVFLKPASSLCQNRTPIRYPDFTQELHYELEIVLQITKPGKHIHKSEALNHVGRWTVGIDFTARDLQSRLKEKGLPWEISKAFDQSALVGDFRTIDRTQLADTHFSLLKNDQQVQLGSTRDLIFSFEELIHYCSLFFTLEAGDLLFTGTPKGVGRVEKGDQLSGFLNGEHLLESTILEH